MADGEPLRPPTVARDAHRNTPSGRSEAPDCRRYRMVRPGIIGRRYRIRRRRRASFTVGGDHSMPATRPTPTANPNGPRLIRDLLGPAIGREGTKCFSPKCPIVRMACDSAAGKVGGGLERVPSPKGSAVATPIGDQVVVAPQRGQRKRRCGAPSDRFHSRSGERLTSCVTAHDQITPRWSSCTLGRSPRRCRPGPSPCSCRHSRPSCPWWLRGRRSSRLACSNFTTS